MNLTQAIGKRILELKSVNDLSIEQLAKMAKVPPSSLKNLIYNKTKHPNVALIYKVCKTLNITLSEFFNSKIFNKIK